MRFYPFTESCGFLGKYESRTFLDALNTAEFDLVSLLWLVFSQQKCLFGLLLILCPQNNEYSN